MIKEVIARGIATSKARFTVGDEATSELVDTHYSLPSTDLHAQAVLDSIRDAGFVIVPKEPTGEMLNAAIDVDSLKLGDIGPLGFRISPQMLFDKCYKAMVSVEEEK